jgi:AP-3 complex subunit delta-1
MSLAVVLKCYGLLHG